MVEATAVSPEGWISHGDLGLWDDAHIQGLSRIAAFANAYGATPGIQIAHAGPKASIRRAFEGNGPLDEGDAARGEHRWAVVSPSARPVAQGWLVPGARGQQDLSHPRRALTYRSRQTCSRTAVARGWHAAQRRWRALLMRHRCAPACRFPGARERGDYGF